MKILVNAHIWGVAVVTETQNTICENLRRNGGILDVFGILAHSEPEWATVYANLEGEPAFIGGFEDSESF